MIIIFSISNPRLSEALKANDDSSKMLWTAGVEGGTGIPFPADAQNIKGLVQLSISRLWLRRLDLEAATRIAFSDLSTDYTFSGRGGIGLAFSRISFSIGCRLGFSAFHVQKQNLGSLWFNAFLINPSVMVQVPLTQRILLKTTLLTMSFYYNKVWMVNWEPAIGMGVRF